MPLWVIYAAYAFAGFILGATLVSLGYRRMIRAAHRAIRAYHLPESTWTSIPTAQVDSIFQQVLNMEPGETPR